MAAQIFKWGLERSKMQLLRYVILVVILWHQFAEARQFSFRYYDDKQTINLEENSVTKPKSFNFASQIVNSVFEIHQFFVKAAMSYIFQDKTSTSSKNFTSLRNKREIRRNFIVKCCGKQTCSQGSRETVERRQESKRKVQEETQLVDQLQYKKPKKKKIRKRPLNSNLQAFGVLTDQGIHISCAGCPAGWPEMLTVYPEYEIGIPVTGSNCPNNWPGALNLLGVGGEAEENNKGGNNFFGFQADNNFGQNFGPHNKFDSSGDRDGGGGNRQSTQFFIKFSTSAETVDQQVSSASSSAAEMVTPASSAVEVIATTVESTPEAAAEVEVENSEGGDEGEEKSQD